MISVSVNTRRVGDARRWSPDCIGHASWAPWQGQPRHGAPQRLPDRVARSISHLSPPTARSTEAVRHCQPDLRPHLAPAPRQKCVAQLTQSLAVFPSTSSTPPSCQFCLGKDEIAVFPHHRLVGPSPELALHAASSPRAIAVPPLPRTRSKEH